MGERACKNCEFGRLHQWWDQNHENTWKWWFGPSVLYENIECRRWPRYEYRHPHDSCGEFRESRPAIQPKEDERDGE